MCISIKLISAGMFNFIQLQHANEFHEYVEAYSKIHFGKFRGNCDNSLEVSSLSTLNIHDLFRRPLDWAITLNISSFKIHL